MPVLFFTGYPGFLGAELLPRLLARDSALTARCLVQPKFVPLARERAAAFGSRVEIVEGDITRPLAARSDDVVEIWHLAAVYDLMVPRAVGLAVNVEGTRNVLDFAANAPALRRFHYVSTCYVSGRYRGWFRESDLAVGQTFNNFYEETKYVAEVLVRERMSGGLPATVYRPAVVVGDSATGATQKFDGPYFVLQLLLRQRRIALLPVTANLKEYRFNMVPRDFVVRAIEYLSALPASSGRTYQLADPDPLTNDEILEVMAAATARRVVRVRVPKAAAKFALQYIPGIERLLRIPAASLDYFAHPTLYDTTQAQADLRGSGIEVPRFRDYALRLAAFMRQHPEVGSAAMV